MKAMDMMSKDTKGINKYIGDVISVKVENILHYTLSSTLLCTIGDDQFFNFFFMFSYGYQ
jgi:hypothetical protein